MRLLGTKSLEPGYKLAVPVMTSSGKVVLNAGVELTSNYIDKLKNMGIYKVYVYDSRFDDIEINNSMDIKKSNTIERAIKETYDNLHKSKAIDEYLIKGISKDIVEYVRESKENVVSVLSTNLLDDYIVEHSFNASLLTAFLGNRMNFNYGQLCDLVSGALIHDLGRDNSGIENHEHVQKGFDAMRKCRGLSLHSSIVCYEHHEKYDGTGYPRKLKGNNISEYTRVITVADVFDNLLHGYGFDGVPTMPHQAYEHILALSGTSLDPEIVERFRDTIVFYPNGCTVILNNGLKGVVSRQNNGSPQRPIIRLFNETGVLGEVDLMRILTIYIKDVIAI